MIEDQNEDPMAVVAEAIKRLTDEVLSLRQLVHLQHAQISALRDASIELIASEFQISPSQAFSDLSKSTRQNYDQHIEKLEKKNPAFAASIDLRASLNRDEQDLWYFPEEDPPQGNEEQSG